MVYRAFAGGKEITGFPIGDKSASEIWGGNTLLWKKNELIPSGRVNSYSLVNKLPCGCGRNIMRFIDYGKLGSDGKYYYQYWDSAITQKPYLKHIQSWLTNDIIEKILSNGTEYPYGTHNIYANETENKIYLLSYGWTSSNGASNARLFLDKFIVLSKDMKVERQYSGTKIEIKSHKYDGEKKSAMHYGGPFFWVENENFHVIVPYVRNNQFTGGYSYIFNSGQIISQDESYFGAAPSDDFYAGGFSLIASSTISYGGKHYLAFPGQSGMYETEENAAAVYKKNGKYTYLGNYSGRYIFTDTSKTMLYEFKDGNMVKKYDLADLDASNLGYKPSEFNYNNITILNGRIYYIDIIEISDIGSLDESGKHVGEVICRTEYITGEKKVISAITSEMNTLYAFYYVASDEDSSNKSKAKYYMEVIPLE